MGNDIDIKRYGMVKGELYPVGYGRYVTYNEHMIILHASEEKSNVALESVRADMHEENCRLVGITRKLNDEIRRLKDNG